MNIGFKDRFVPYVEDGTKRHTIRAGQRWRAGMRADLFEKPRQKGMRLLFRAYVTRVDTITIGRDLLKVGSLIVLINGVELSADEREAFFHRDGFRPEPGDPFTSTSMAAALSPICVLTLLPDTTGVRWKCLG